MPDKRSWPLMISHREEWVGVDLKGQSLHRLNVEVIWCDIRSCKTSNYHSIYHTRYLHVMEKHIVYQSALSHVANALYTWMARKLIHETVTLMMENLPMFPFQSKLHMEGFRSLKEGEAVEFTFKKSSKGLESQRVTGPGGIHCVGSERRPKGKKVQKRRSKGDRYTWMNWDTTREISLISFSSMFNYLKHLGVRLKNKICEILLWYTICKLY